MLVREKPPTRLHHLVTSPSGRTARWGEDEPSPENVPNGVQFSTSTEGGHDTSSCSLPRKPGVAYADLTPFSNWRIQGPGGECAWEGQIRDTPRESGNERAINPQGRGYKAHLEDDKSAQEIYIDRELGHWGGASTQRKINLLAATRILNVDVAAGGQDTGARSAGVGFTFTQLVATFTENGESWYYGGGADLGKIRYSFDGHGTDAAFVSRADLYTDDLASSGDTGTDHNAADATNQTVTASVAGRKYGRLLDEYGGATTGTTSLLHIFYDLCVLGNHGLTERGTWPDIGFYASDVLAHALRTWAPLIRFTEGANGTLTPTSFIIPQLEFRDPTTVAQIVRAANRFHIRDWFIWEGQRPGEPTFYYHDRGARGKSWRARISSAQLAETGQSADRVWNGVIVRYQDVTGQTRSVGPEGSGAHTEDSNLQDDDPLNPANQKGIRRWELLDMGGVSTSAGAIEVGRRFLIEANQLDTSGQARLVGYVEDDKGVLHPAWKVRAGDTISFVDAADKSARRIVKTSYDHSTRTNSIDLDAPPEGMAALLERLMVVLVPLGL